MRLRVTGVDDIDQLLSEVGPREAKNIMRATVHGMAGEVRNEARKNSPVDQGALKKATKAKRRRQQGTVIRSDVVVGKAAFYWRFLEYGQGPDMVEYAMFAKAAEFLRSKMNEILRRQFGKKWESAMKRRLKRG